MLGSVLVACAASCCSALEAWLRGDGAMPASGPAPQRPPIRAQPRPRLAALMALLRSPRPPCRSACRWPRVVRWLSFGGARVWPAAHRSALRPDPGSGRRGGLLATLARSGRLAGGARPGRLQRAARSLPQLCRLAARRHRRAGPGRHHGAGRAAALPDRTRRCSLAYVLLFLPRAMVGLRASLAQVPVELEQAAMALGRPPLRRCAAGPRCGSPRRASPPAWRWSPWASPPS